MSKEIIIPIILCGGTGTRLWPLSGKVFLNSFYQLTVEINHYFNQLTRELKKLNGIKDPILICNEEYILLLNK